MLAAFVLAGTATEAIAAIEIRPVQFARGATSATLSGRISGDQTIDYKLRAMAGQTMSVSMTASRNALYFNVLPPGSQDVAIHIGSTSGNQWSARLPADGEYTVRVYLMRNEARRGTSADYTLTMGITGTTAATSDAKVPGTVYHATGKVPCSLGSSAAGPTQCEFGVVRAGPGRASVTLSPAGGPKRTLSFDGDKVSADGGATVRATRQGDEWNVEVNDLERYRIPDAVINGG